ncbi:NRDE family protein [Stakelama sediminis]|uniref:NRDE family protein n=1 Tax=Stakelama sediminis TaxID=463200 RepID=UPI001608620A|nr:NRDE family protein [Stakelama sediminis]
MCVLAIAWRVDPRWRLVAAGNRDELHARPALPLARWEDVPGLIAGGDAVGGGTWLGVQEAGRFAVVTNVRNPQGPDPAKRSRGGLVTDALTQGMDALGAVEAYNPFNLIVVDGATAMLLSNRPEPVRHMLEPGVHGLSNGLHDAPWPKTRAVERAVADWIDAGDESVEPLFAALRDERAFGASDGDALEPVNSPVFMRNARYGTRCSTVVTVDADGNGAITERRFDAGGEETGETCIRFCWQ